MKNILIYFLAFIFMVSPGGIYIKSDTTGYYCDTAYFESGTVYYNETETFTYDSYTVSQVFVTNGLPVYDNYTQTNSCAPMAGAILLAFYDYYYDDLIPDYTSACIYNNKFYYMGQSAKFNSLKEHLYDLMGTNTISQGTSLLQFVAGLTSYVNSQGFSMNFDYCGNGSNVNLFIEKFNNNTPVVVFLNSYDYTPFGNYSVTDTEMTLIKRVSSNGHVAVACGYREYHFFKDGVDFRTDKYLITSFGNGTQGLLKINDCSKMDTSVYITLS